MKDNNKKDFVLVGDAFDPDAAKQAFDALGDKLKATARKACEDHLISDADLRMAVDLGEHAARQAFAAIGRILDTVPAKGYPAAVAITHALLQWGLDETNRQLDLASPGFTRTVHDLKEVHAKHRSGAFRADMDAARKRTFGR